MRNDMEVLILGLCRQILIDQFSSMLSENKEGLLRLTGMNVFVGTCLDRPSTGRLNHP